MKVLRTISPVNGEVCVERPYATPAEVEAALDRAKKAQADWKYTPLDQRAEILSRAVDAFVGRTDVIAEELSWQMGRPIKYAPGEVRGFEERARMMIRLATDSLADVRVSEKEGFNRFIRREPLGTVLTMAAWNYPYLIAVNSVWPALMAGNAVVLKHSSQTPLCGERMGEALAEAGLPDGLYQNLFLSHSLTADVVKDSRVDFVAFTGSVEGGQSVHEAGGGTFKAIGLELGGKDPAYVRGDADLAQAIENLVDGAFFNSGQSCCGIERIYVHQSLFDDFVDGCVSLVNKYTLGNPLDKDVTLGPVVRTSAAKWIRGQIDEAIAAGAKPLIDSSNFALDNRDGPHMAPQVLVNVDHTMKVMMEETFGPVVGIMPVETDEQAIELMNDSPYGLTASVWTKDEEAALHIGDRVDTGTWFMNRCDYLDPELAWVGVKDSGRGCTLSHVGYEHLTRPKSFHVRR